MEIESVFIRRSLGDTDKVMRAAMKSANRVGGRVRARVMEELFKSRVRFNIREYIVKQLEPVLLQAMLAGHYAGYRRLWLATDQGLTLSALSDALNALKKRAGIDIEALQRKYQTQALKVLNDASAVIEEQLRETMEDLILTGAHKAEAIRVLSNKFESLGLVPKKDWQLETIFRTQLQLTFSAGKFEAESDPDIQEILWGYKYVTVGDDRVRETHAAIDGTTLPKDDPFWRNFYPPNGWNCRCQVIPIFEQREIVQPKQLTESGAEVVPDKGFNFNPGLIYQNAV